MEIERLRRERWTGVRIAQQLGLSPATVSRVLRRMKLNRIRDLEPKLPPNRDEHAAPCDMLHLDIKRLVRIQRPSHRVTGNRRDSVKGIGADVGPTMHPRSTWTGRGVSRGQGFITAEQLFCGFRSAKSAPTLQRERS
jgi:hypothetical protein